MTTNRQKRATNPIRRAWLVNQHKVRQSAWLAGSQPTGQEAELFALLQGGTCKIKGNR
jgi:hypothetical protein